MTPEYTAALVASQSVILKFQAAQKAYRALKIGDSEYLAARAEYEQGMKAYDAAYAKEADSAQA